MKKEIWAVILFFVAAFALWWLAYPAKIECSYDGPGHVAQAWFYKYSLQNYLRIPWTNPFMWDGSLFMVFHAPLFYALAGALSLVVNQIIATKLLVFLSYILSLYSMYLLAKEYGLGNRASLLAGMIYTFSNWHLFSTFFRAAYLDAFGYALLPLPFLYAKRGLAKNLAQFVTSAALLVLSHQVTLLYVIPAIAVYIIAIEGWNVVSKREFGVAALWLLLLLLFFATPLIALKGEAGPATTGLSAVSFDGGLSFPLNFAMPQWGIRYQEIYDRFWFFPQRNGSNNSYVGVLHVLLFALGIYGSWKKYPELTGVVAVSFGFFLGLLPGINPHAAERVLFIFNLPLSIFAVMGMEAIGKWGEKRLLAVFAGVILANVGGIWLLLRVYSLRSNGMMTSAPVVPVAMMVAVAATVTMILALYKKRKIGWAALIVVLLALEVAPNAINPTMLFPTASQTDPCAYRTLGHEFLANPRGIMCAMSCDNGAYLFQNHHFEISSKGLYGRWSAIEADTSTCNPELGALGIRYCFQPGNVTELEPAPFVNSTSKYRIEKDEPDNLAIGFDTAGKTTVRLGYFSFYRAFSGERELKLTQSPDGFIGFDNPAGRVELKVVPPRSFMYAYLISAVAGLALLASGIRVKKKGKLEWLLLLGLAVILAHILIRLLWMGAGLS